MRDTSIIIFLLIIVAIATLFLIIKIKTESKEKKNDTIDQQFPLKKFEVKNSLMTDCEKEFYNAILKAVPPSYIVIPQVNLASIIRHTDNVKYANDLFRNIDFGIFNSDFKPIALIEINDKTHEEDKSRQARDYKVKNICNEAEIPLITLWTKYGVNQEYIDKRIAEVL